MTPTEILVGIGAAQAKVFGYAAVVDISEHESLVFDMPRTISTKEIVNLYEVLNAPALLSLLKASVTYRSDGMPQLRLVTNSRVGFSSVRVGPDDFFVRVRPKVESQRFLELSFWAGTLPNFKSQTDVATEDFANILEWMLEMFMSAMEVMLVKGGVRSTHERVERVLRNRVRGKLMIPGFMGSLAKGRPDQIPCQFSELTIDNSANRLLRWALSAVGKLARELVRNNSISARTALIDRHFRDVSIARPAKRSLERGTFLPPNQRHYADVIRIAKMLLLGFQIDSSPGATPSLSFSVNMNDVFEKSFLNLSRIYQPGVQAKPAWIVDFHEHGQQDTRLSVQFEPDIYVNSSPGQDPIVIDTKWKSAAKYYQDTYFIKPNTSDIYQIATYAYSVLRDQSKTKRCIGVLMYPSLTDCAQLIHRIHIGGFEVLVVIMSWNVSLSPSVAVEAIWTFLSSLRTADGNHEILDHVTNLRQISASVDRGH